MIRIEDPCENTNGALFESGMLGFDSEICSHLLSSLLVVYFRSKPLLKFLVLFRLSTKVEAQLISSVLKRVQVKCLESTFI